MPGADPDIIEHGKERVVVIHQQSLVWLVEKDAG